MNMRINKIRSTNKEVKEKIREHIIERLDPDYEGTLPDKLQHVINGFKSWLGPNGLRGYQTYQDAFKGYLQCIPGTLDAEFATCYQERALNDWMGVPDKDYDADYIESYYYALIYREFKMLCKLTSINF